MQPIHYPTYPEWDGTLAATFFLPRMNSHRRPFVQSIAAEIRRYRPNVFRIIFSPYSSPCILPPMNLGFRTYTEAERTLFRLRSDAFIHR